jgi:hypothetical protein
MSARVLTPVRDSDWPAVNVMLAPQSSYSPREFQRGPGCDYRVEHRWGHKRARFGITCPIRSVLGCRRPVASAVSDSAVSALARFTLLRFQTWHQPSVGVGKGVGVAGVASPATILSGARAALTLARFRVSVLLNHAFALFLRTCAMHGSRTGARATDRSRTGARVTDR